MSRAPAPTRNPLMRGILAFARRKTGQLAGRIPDDGIAPLEIYATSPRLLLSYAALEDATMRMRRVDKRLKALAELKAATLSQCEYCIDIGSQIARRHGITSEQLLALPRYRESEHFDEVERLVLDYAVGMSSTPVDIPDELFDRLREHFDDAQILELTNIIAVENMRGRFNLAYGLGAAGFSEGMVCAVPDRVAEGQPATAQA